MKRWKKLISIRHYLGVLKRQPAHMQHVFALLFAGIITGTLAALILYVDYGFWHERYVREEVVTEANPTDVSESKSPLQLFGAFLEDAKVRISEIKNETKDAFDGVEVYNSAEAEAQIETQKTNSLPSEERGE